LSICVCIAAQKLSGRLIQAGVDALTDAGKVPVARGLEHDARRARLMCGFGWNVPVMWFS